MAFLPLEPTYARSVIASKENGCTLEVLDIISVLSASSKLFIDITEQRENAAEARKLFRHTSGDHLTILNSVRAYEEISAGSGGKMSRREWCRKHFLNERTLLEAAEIRNQLRQTCMRLGIEWKVSCGDEEEPVVRSLAYGLAQNSAFLQPDGSYKQTMGQSVNPILISFFSYCTHENLGCQDSSWFGLMREKGASYHLRRVGMSSFPVPTLQAYRML